MIRFIWAQDANGLIGSKGKIPWYNREDLNYFKNQTTGGIVVMGSRTWFSLGCKPLKNRHNIILTREDDIKGYDHEDVYIAHTAEEVIEVYENSSLDLWIIGGAMTYKTFEPWCEEAVVSTVEGEYEGDTYYRGLADKLTEENVVVIMKGNGFTVKHYKVK